MTESKNLKKGRGFWLRKVNISVRSQKEEQVGEQVGEQQRIRELTE